MLVVSYNSRLNNFTEDNMTSYKKIIYSFIVLSFFTNSHGCKGSWTCWCEKIPASSTLEYYVKDTYPGEIVPEEHLKFTSGSEEFNLTIDTCGTTGMKQKGISSKEVVDVLVSANLHTQKEEFTLKCSNGLCVFFEKTGKNSVEVSGAFRES